MQFCQSQKGLGQDQNRKFRGGNWESSLSWLSDAQPADHGLMGFLSSLGTWPGLTLHHSGPCFKARVRQDWGCFRGPKGGSWPTSINNSWASISHSQNGVNIELTINSYILLKKGKMHQHHIGHIQLRSSLLSS